MINWKIHRISIPVFDIEESKYFYFNILNSFPSKIYTYGNNEECYIEGGDIKLRLYKLKGDLQKQKIIQSRRTYPTISITNFDRIINNFNKNNIDFIYLKSDFKNKIETVLLQEPSLNFIELIDSNSLNNNFKKDFNWKFHHINLECYNVRLTAKFFAKYLEIKEGNWKPPIELGKVNIKKSQLAIFPLGVNHSGLHLNKADFSFGWRNNFLHNPTLGGHPAFEVKDITKFKKKLKKLNIPFTDAKIYAMPYIYQIYLFDPNANIIEINQNTLN